MNWYRKANKMDDLKKAKLEANGWKVGSAEEFLYGTLYVDLDGVLAWWEKGANDMCEGVSFDDFPIETGDPKRDIIQDFMDDNYEFWSGIPRMPHFDKLWNAVKDHSPMILTSPHDVKDEDCKRGKEDWCKKHLNLDSDRVLVKREKWHWAKDADGKPNILVDDMDKNLDAWEEHGGIAIKVTEDNTDEVVKELSRYLK